MLDEIVKGYQERIAKCERQEHRYQPRTPSGGCDWCHSNKIEIILLGRDPQTGHRVSWLRTS